MKSLFLIIIVLCGCTLTVCAATRFVSPAGANIPPYTTWAGAATDIRNAVQVAQPYDTVLVTNGFYTPPATITVSQEGLIIRSVNGADSTIVSGAGLRKVFNIQSSASLDGFTITNGYNAAFDTGGGISLNRGSVENCIIVGCRGMLGAGISVSSHSVVENCVIRNNTATHVAGGVLITTDGILRDSLVINNRVSSIGPLTNLYFGGGGILNYVGGIVERCVISNNSSASYGGGITVLSNGVFQQCTISANSAALNGGGALCYEGGFFQSCLFSDNSALKGGGLFIQTNALVQNCTIVNNSATTGGGAYFNIGGRSVNSILYFNSAAVGPNFYITNAASLSFCDTWPSVPLPFNTGQCITSDPAFVNYPLDNFHLTAASPSVDSGTNLPGIRQLLDLDGNGRVSNIVDRGAYERGLPAPSVVITSSLSRVSFDIHHVSLSGTNNASLSGGMWVANSANSVVSNFSRSGFNWLSPALPVTVGTNIVTVSATNAEGFITHDSATILRLGPGSGTPFVDITNKPSSVLYDQNIFYVSGTNNINVVGNLWITNVVNGFHERFIPTLGNWFSVAVHLSPGTNDVYVYATNVFGQLSSDTVRLVRRAATGVPVITITTALSQVTYDTASLYLAGTHNGQVAGIMWVSNLTLGVQSLFAADPAWTAPAVPLQVGPNSLVVGGSNLVNQSAFDSITVTRGVPGTGSPFVNCTNALSTVAESVSSFAIAGTNNPNVVGKMRVKNMANNQTKVFSASPAWSAPAVSLTYGLNDIEVYGTNKYGALSRDLILITRNGPATGPPYVDVISTSTWGSYDMAAFSVQGTNNSHVVGTMLISNAATHAIAYFSSQLSWTAPPAPLAVGPNTLWAIGRNAAGSQAWDSVTVYRNIPGTGTPRVYITNANRIVTYDVSAWSIAGTNNANVLPGSSMLVSNMLNASAASFSASHAWSAPSLPLAVGTNLFIVSATNSLGATAATAAVIIRESPGSGLPWTKFIIPPILSLNPETDSVVLQGTNNANVVGSMWLTNKTTGFSVPFPATRLWNTPAIPLIIGSNYLVVFGTNYYNQVTNDTILVIRRLPGYGIPVISITNAVTSVTYDIDTFNVAGVNNLNVQGSMWVSNAANGAVHSFAATQTWTAVPMALEIGVNALSVYGSNYLSQVTNDTVYVTRGIPGTGLPRVSITSDVAEVHFTTDSYIVAGTNNLNVVGTMWVSNDAASAVHFFPAAPAWTAPAIALNRHINIITVSGTNLLGQVNTDTLVVDRPVPVGATNFVSHSGSHEWPFITWATAATNVLDAVETSRDSNTIMINAGVFRVDSCLLIDKEILVKGQGSAHTVLQPVSGLSSSFVIMNNGILDGVSLATLPGTVHAATNGAGAYLLPGSVMRNCSVSGFLAYTAGGGVYCNGAVISNCVISANFSAWHGGGVYIDSNGSLLASRVTDNHAAAGGGAYLFYQGLIKNCSFRGNIADTNANPATASAQADLLADAFNGGAVYLENGGSIDSCSLSANRARNGAAIYILSQGSVRNCSITDNIAQYYAAVYCEYGGSIDSCRIRNNIAYNSGGVILDRNGHMRNSVVAGNIATDIGGVYVNNNSTIENCTICNNVASDACGGLAASAGATVRNCIIYYNAANTFSNYQALSSPVTVQNCSTFPAVPGSGVITNDPALAHPASGFYRPSHSSPCINAGTNLPWMTIATDLLGRSRIINATVDIGAYEFTNEPIAWTDPAPVRFGNVFIDNASAVILTVGNAGSQSLNGQLQNVDPPFSIISGASYSLAPDEQSEAILSLDPIALGAYTNVMTVSGALAEQVILYGVCLRSLAVSTQLLDFGDILVGDSVQKNIGLHNLGFALVTGSASNVLPPFALVSGSPYILGPESSTNLFFSFSPQSEDGFTNLVYLSGGGDSYVVLRGTGIPEPAGLLLILLAGLVFLKRPR